MMEPAASRPPDNRFDLVALGESMLSLSPVPGTTTFSSDIAGAESNVARNVAALGLRAGWVSRLGDDVAGPLVHAAIANSGVDTGDVTVTADAPTGLMLKGAPGTQPRVQYHRRGSAASGMSTSNIDVGGCLDTAVLHLTGITMALSESCRALVLELLDAPSTAIRSFDVNWRPALWSSEPSAADLLADAANRADVVFVGLDEAEAVWGLTTPADVRALIDRPRRLVVKNGAIDVTTFVDDVAHSEPALRGTVVDPMGAGDAFAAGYLTGIVRYPDDVHRCQRLGHITAMSAVTSPNDVGHPLAWDEIERLLALSSHEWAEMEYPDGATDDG
ncbi:MAG: sugar kinase [Ilumatobacteraceae bacterium]|nr:sugar kinase [Ilumatobacteraceae bacterium]